MLGLRQSKCKFWNPLEISLGIHIPSGCILVTNGLRILGVLMGSWDFAMHFLDEILFQNVAHIDDFFPLGYAQVSLGILCSCVTYSPSYLTHTLFHFFSIMSLLVGFDKRIMHVCGDIMGPRSWESFQGPLARHKV
jgi:hypothetical protein